MLVRVSGRGQVIEYEERHFVHQAPLLFQTESNKPDDVGPILLLDGLDDFWVREYVLESHYDRAQA